jgi:hypothetical protein
MPPSPPGPMPPPRFRSPKEGMGATLYLDLSKASSDSSSPCSPLIGSVVLSWRPPANERPPSPPPPPPYCSGGLLPAPPSGASPPSRPLTPCGFPRDVGRLPRSPSGGAARRPCCGNDNAPPTAAPAPPLALGIALPPTPPAPPPSPTPPRRRLAGSPGPCLSRDGDNIAPAPVCPPPASPLEEPPPPAFFCFRPGAPAAPPGAPVVAVDVGSCPRTPRRSGPACPLRVWGLGFGV